MVDGHYQVSYRTSEQEGPGGRLSLSKGQIVGSDAGYKWNGKYYVNGSDLQGELVAENERNTLNIFNDTAPIHMNITGRIQESGCINITGERINTEQKMEAILKPIKF